MRLGWNTAGRTPALLLGVGLVLVAADTPRAGSKIFGQVVDEDGNPVSDVVVRFTLEDDETTTRTIEVKKKGRFTDSSLPPGRYGVDLEEPARYVASAEFDVRNANDLRIGSGKIEGHPRRGVSGLPVSDHNEIRLTLVVAPRGETDAGDRELAISAQELNAAVKHFNRAEYEQAADEAARVQAENPDLAEALYIRAVALEKLGRLAEAESFLSQAAPRMPDYPKIWAALGEIELKLAAEHEAAGDADATREAYARAARALTRAIERDPDTLALQINLAASLDRTGQTDRLKEVLEGVVARDPSHLPSRLRLAGLYTANGDLDRATALLEQIPTTEKRAAVTIYNVAVGLNEEGDIDGSLLMARRAAEIDPELPQARRLIAQILLGKNDPPAAIEAIKVFLALAPDDPEAEVYRRILSQLEGD